MTEPSALASELLEVVRAIAAEPENQVRWLREKGYAPDELAETLSDALLHRWWLGAHGEDSDALLTLRQLDAHFASVSGSGNRGRWTEEALATDLNWEEARRQARALLPKLQSQLSAE